MNTAMILCAGYGTRLEKYTKRTPKPMLQISGKPLLEYTIEHLARYDIRNIIINLNYLADQITSYFEDGNKWGVKITYSYERSLLGTAGAVKNVEYYLKDINDFLVIYGDVICDENYENFINFHRSKKGAVASIIVHKRMGSNSIVEIDSENRIIKFIERPDKDMDGMKHNWVNSGIYSFNKSILEYIPSGVFCDFPRDIFPELVSEGHLYGYELKGYRCSVDSPERYIKVQNDLARKVFSWH